VIFVILGICSVILHETGHVVAALLKGVPIGDITFAWYLQGPGITVPDYFPTEQLSFFRYGGGVFSGILFLIAYILIWVFLFRANVPGKPWSSRRWLIGSFTIFLAAFQIYNGYLEGFRFEEYVRIPSTIQEAVFIGLPVSLAIHLGTTWIWKKRVKPAEEAA
jgi:hypothetical protein